MTVDRRRLLAGVPAAVVGSALFASAATACSKAGPEKAGPENASSVNGPEVHWRMMVSWPKDLSIMYGGAQFVADRVKAMTGGRFTMDLNVEGDLDTKDDLMTAVSKGFVQCGHSSSDYYVDKNAGLTFGSGAPFGLTAAEHASWLRFGGGMDLISSTTNSGSCTSRRATPAHRWAAGSTTKSGPPTTSTAYACASAGSAPRS